MLVCPCLDLVKQCKPAGSRASIASHASVMGCMRMACSAAAWGACQLVEPGAAGPRWAAGGETKETATGEACASRGVAWPAASPLKSKGRPAKAESERPPPNSRSPDGIDAIVG